MTDNVTPFTAKHWSSQLRRTQEGKVKNLTGNIMAVLENIQELSGAIVFDEMEMAVMQARELPWNDQAGRFWTDHDTINLMRWLNAQGFEFAHDTLERCINAVADSQRCHPLREWLNELRWDGQPRVDKWLSYYLGADDSTYTREVGMRWLVSAVARVMKPGCKADHVLVLEGTQGVGKSTALLNLFGDRYFADSLSDVGNKDAAIAVQGIWCIELAEMDAMTRSTTTAMKAFITRRQDKFRPPYGRRDIRAPRQCVFAGTVNHSRYLKDETGNRRFWPVETKSIDLDAIAHDRAQLWAETVAMFRQGEHWHLVGSTMHDLARLQQLRRVDFNQAWYEVLADKLGGQKTTKLRECLDMLGFPPHQVRGHYAVEIGKVLRELGFSRDERDQHDRTWRREL
jgi:predicted P-loop ATPase